MAKDSRKIHTEGTEKHSSCADQGLPSIDKHVETISKTTIGSAQGTCTCLTLLRPRASPLETVPTEDQVQLRMLHPFRTKISRSAGGDRPRTDDRVSLGMVDEQGVSDQHTGQVPQKMERPYSRKHKSARAAGKRLQWSVCLREPKPMARIRQVQAGSSQTLRKGCT